MTELPEEIRGPSAWYGPDIAGRAEWIEPLSTAEVSEIELAGRRLERMEVDWQSLSTNDFPLPTLKPRLARMLDEVLYGRGFVLLRGLPVERWNRRCRRSRCLDWDCTGGACDRRTGTATFWAM